MHYYREVLRKYADFAGRARRREYWMFTLWNAIIGFLIGFVAGIIAATQHTHPLISVPSIIYGLVILIPSLAVTFRRLHDTNRSAWWLLISLVPIIGSIVLLIFLVTDSTPGTNKYGPNPKGA